MILSKNHFLGTIFVVSLASNFFLVGLIVGRHTSPPFLDSHGGSRPMGPMAMVRGLEDSLSPADAKIFQGIVDNDLRPFDDKDMPSLFATMETLLKAPVFDPKAFHATMQQIHDQHSTMDTAFVNSVSEAAAKISPEGRARLADAISKLPHGGPDPHGRFDGPDGPPLPPQ